MGRRGTVAPQPPPATPWGKLATATSGGGRNYQKAPHDKPM